MYLCMASVQVVAAGADDDDEGDKASNGGGLRGPEDGGNQHAQDSAEEGKQLRRRGGFNMDDAVQGFGDDEASDVQDEMEAEIERPAEGTASRSKQRLGAPRISPLPPSSLMVQGALTKTA